MQGGKPPQCSFSLTTAVYGRCCFHGFHRLDLKGDWLRALSQMVAAAASILAAKVHIPSNILEDRRRVRREISRKMIHDHVLCGLSGKSVCLPFRLPLPAYLPDSGGQEKYLLPKLDRMPAWVGRFFDRNLAFPFAACSVFATGPRGTIGFFLVSLWNDARCVVDVAAAEMRLSIR